MLAVGGHDGVLGRQGLEHSNGHRLLAVVEVQEAANFGGGVELGALLLQPPDADHGMQQVQSMNAVQGGSLRFPRALRFHSAVSSVERSPSGRPSSRALSRRRMILPALFLGRLC